MSVRVEWSDKVVTVVIDRPDKRNAVDLPTLHLLLAAQAEAAERGCRALVLTGAPPAFCSGADLADVEHGVFTDTLSKVLLGFVGLRCVTIAAIDGPTLGAGVQLAAACDLRMATTTSRFGVPAARLGLAVDSWTVGRLCREAGWSVTRDMLLSAETQPTERLLGGFVHRIGTVDEAREWARAMSALAPLTIAAHKQALEHLAGEAVTGGDVEAARLAAWESNDAVEGRRAFREKRPPEFSGE